MEIERNEENYILSKGSIKVNFRVREIWDTVKVQEWDGWDSKDGNHMTLDEARVVYRKLLSIGYARA
jgi:hypothetical protein